MKEQETGSLPAYPQRSEASSAGTPSAQAAGLEKSGAVRRPETPGAIILGGGTTALGIARSLGTHGVPVWTYHSDPSIANASRFVKRSVVSDREKHALLMEDAAAYGLEGWIVFPTDDEDVELLSLHHESLSSVFRLTTPPYETARFALDKRLTYQRARELGIGTPWTRIVQGIDQLDPEDLPYPVILKPALNHRFFPQTRLKALAVDVPSDLVPKYREMLQWIPAGEIMIQERIPGDGRNQYSCAALCEGGTVLASLAALRRRQYPVDFGTSSTFVETIEDSEVEQAGRSWLQSAGFDGLAEVEFKRDPRDGRLKILDVNARPWVWHMLGKAAGVDFVYSMWRRKAGLPVAFDGPRRPAAWCREPNDLLAVLQSGRPLAEAGAWLRAALRGRLTMAMVSLKDPRPLVSWSGFRGAARLVRKASQSEGRAGDVAESR